MATHRPWHTHPTQDPPLEVIRAFQSYVDDRINSAAEAHRELVDMQISGLRDLMSERTISQQRAIDVLAGVTGEFRTALSEQMRATPTRQEMEAHAQGNAARITAIASRLDILEGANAGSEQVRAGARANTNLILAGGGVLIALLTAVIAVFFTNKVDASPAGTPSVVEVHETLTVTTTP